MSSGFALQLHALLCRAHVKGHDWYDFAWYGARKIKPHLDLLRQALPQQGLWATAGAAPDAARRLPHPAALITPPLPHPIALPGGHHDRRRQFPPHSIW